MIKLSLMGEVKVSPPRGLDAVRFKGLWQGCVLSVLGSGVEAR